MQVRNGRDFLMLFIFQIFTYIKNIGGGDRKSGFLA